MRKDNHGAPDIKEEGKDERKTEQIWTDFVRASYLTNLGLGETLFTRAHLQAKAQAEPS